MRTRPPPAASRLPHAARGRWVRVRSEPEILATLDAEGRLEGMPFMPEMARFIGQTFQVRHRAVKTCVEGHAFRRLGATVLLEGPRCDGAFHEGCQRNCTYFWKDAWLAPVDPDAPPPGPCPSRPEAWQARFPTRDGERFVCQSTELLRASRRLSRWDLVHLVVEIGAGELSVPRFFRIVVHSAANRVRELLGLKRLRQLTGTQGHAPRGDLDLQPGEWVVVKPAPEIRSTLDSGGRNRGLSFEPTMVDFAGGRFRVDFPIRRIISEQTGRMVCLAHTVALEGVTCSGLCAKNCPRNNILFWREAWLKRVPGPSVPEA